MRTCTSTNGDIVIVVNWNAMKSRTLNEIERVLAHESGHVLIDKRGEEPYDDLEAHLYDIGDLNTAYIVGMAVEEYRCETAVHKAGYPVENSHTDSVSNRSVPLGVSYRD